MGEFLENERKVADAIILERAERVLSRHRPAESSPRADHDTHASAEFVLRRKARELRQEAESGD